MTDPNAGSGNINEDTGLTYEHVEDATFEAALGEQPWEPMFGGLALKAACAICHGPNAIDVFVPVVTAMFRDQTPTAEFVQCQCVGKHDAPAGVVGCGRYGMIRPRMPGPAKAADDGQ